MDLSLESVPATVKYSFALLRDVGLTDREIPDAVEVISCFNYINRVADALGIDPEP